MGSITVLPTNANIPQDAGSTNGTYVNGIPSFGSATSSFSRTNGGLYQNGALVGTSDNYTAPTNGGSPTGGGTPTGGTGTTTGPANGWNDVANQGYLNGTMYRDKNQWLAAGGQAPGPSLADQTRNDINSGYNDYFSQLDNMLKTSLPSSYQDMLDKNESVYGQNKADLNSNAALQNTQLDDQTNQINNNHAKNLRDLASNIDNMLQSGNVYLGAQGAGDSSAANQYSYALNKLASQRQGDENFNNDGLLQQVNNHRSQIGQIVTNELGRLDSTRQQNISDIGKWYNDQLANVQGQIAQGHLDQGKDLSGLSQTLLNQALNRLNMIDVAHQNQTQALNQWASYNSKNVPQLAQNMAEIAQMGQQQLPTMGQLQGIVGNNQQAQQTFVPGSNDNNLYSSIYGQ